MSYEGKSTGPAC